MIKIINAMYNPETDCVEISLDEQIHVSFDCQKCNAYLHNAFLYSSDFPYNTSILHKYILVLID